MCSQNCIRMAAGGLWARTTWPQSMACGGATSCPPTIESDYLFLVRQSVALPCTSQ